MRTRFPAVLIALSAVTVGCSLSAQTAPAGPPPATIPTASSILRPALNQIGNGLSTVQLDKWKTPGSIRQEASANMSSISRDLDGTLPTLLATADAKPASIPDTLPVYRNVDALYDVLLRVTEAADHGAPRDQAAALESALSALENARHALGDSLLEASVLQDTRIAKLQAGLEAAKVAPVPVPTCPEVHEPHHPVRRHHREQPQQKKQPQPSSSSQAPPK
jgi:hypothetical protein